ncbi:MAG: xylulose kinase [Candidatus Hydrogenedentes bacterium]|nr:xylulose kinase [Candidatus Hydrogenedentota bacterium]
MMETDPYVLAIDLGTSGCKVALVSKQGHVAGWEFEEVETTLLPGGGAEQDPEAWWQAFLRAGRRLLAKNAALAEKVIALCSSTQGEGTVAVDRDGSPLMPCILWMDTRGVAYLKQITGGLIRVAGYDLFKLYRWIHLTGGAPSLTGKDPAAHMLLIKYAFPDIYARTYKFLNVLDFMNLRLTGRFVATYDSITTSWVTDNRDPTTIDYSNALIRCSGVDRDKFPDLVPCTESLGPLRSEVAEALGLAQGIPVVAGSIDTTAAAIGSGAIEDYALHLYLGTSSWMAAHVPFKKTDIFSSIASLPCAVPGRFLMTALQATAGGNLSFLRDKILYHKDELLSEAQTPDVYKIMDRIVERTPPGSHGVLFTPWSYGERSPVDDPYIRAAIHNLSLHNSREDIVRAFFEGVAFNNRWLLRPVQRFLGKCPESITLTGGGAASDIWCQIFADILGLTVRQLANPIQVNSLGAAFIAFVGLGILRYEEAAQLTRYKGTYTPNPETQALYDRCFREFVALYKHNKAIYRRLNRGAGR